MEIRRIKCLVDSRSYEVKLDDNERTLRRNRNFLRKTSEDQPPAPVMDETPISNTEELPILVPETTAAPTAVDTAPVNDTRRSNRARAAPSYLKDYVQ